MTLTMPPENALAIHALMAVHTLMTALCFIGGPVMIREAWKNRAGPLYWFFAGLPLVVEAQRLIAGDRCVVQDIARELWQIEDTNVWAPDLYFVDQSWVTYVVDACIVSYAVGLIVSIALFLHHRHGLFARLGPRQSRRTT